jgi:hypothetical protein
MMRLDFVAKMARRKNGPALVVITGLDPVIHALGAPSR